MNILDVGIKNCFFAQESRNPPIDILVTLSREFGVTTDYLITGKIRSMKDFVALSDLLAYNNRDPMQSISLSCEELAMLIVTQLEKDRTGHILSTCCIIVFSK